MRLGKWKFLYYRLKKRDTLEFPAALKSFLSARHFDFLRRHQEGHLSTGAFFIQSMQTSNSL